MMNLSLSRHSFLIAMIFVIALGSCKPKETSILPMCEYMFKEFAQTYDSTQYQKKENLNLGVTEIYDTVKFSNEKCYYQFDRKGTLRFFAFLTNDSGDYSYSLTYDTTGKQTEKTGNSEVVWWYEKPKGKDSLIVSFLLYGIGVKYQDIQIKYNNQVFSNIEIKKHFVFLNLQGNNINIMPHIGVDTLYIKGKRKEECSGKISDFTDLVLVN
jgi:hypothetical protein